MFDDRVRLLVSSECLKCQFIVESSFKKVPHHSAYQTFYYFFFTIFLVRFVVDRTELDMRSNKLLHALQGSLEYRPILFSFFLAHHSSITLEPAAVFRTEVVKPLPEILSFPQLVCVFCLGVIWFVVLIQKSWTNNKQIITKRIKYKHVLSYIGIFKTSNMPKK